MHAVHNSAACTHSQTRFLAIADATLRCLSDGPKTATPPPDTARGATADLCDVHFVDSVDVVVEPSVQIMQPLFKDLGGNMRFSGPAATVKCFENNPLVRKVCPQAAFVALLDTERVSDSWYAHVHMLIAHAVVQALEEEGTGRVLVVDAGASLRCAVLGDNLAAMGVKNGWSVRSLSSEQVLNCVSHPCSR